MPRLAIRCRSLLLFRPISVGVAYRASRLLHITEATELRDAIQRLSERDLRLLELRYL